MSGLGVEPSVAAAYASLARSVQAADVGGKSFAFNDAEFRAAYASFKQAWESVKQDRVALEGGLGACYGFRINGITDATFQADMALLDPNGSATEQLRGLEFQLAGFVNQLRAAYVTYLETDDESAFRLAVAAASSTVRVGGGPLVARAV